MRKKNLLVLGVFLIILAAVIKFHVLPKIPSIRMDQKLGKKAEPIVNLGAEIRLPDGSFNPNPSTPTNPKESPAALTQTPWRERYRPFLEKAQAPANTPGFYVYPFLDQTTQGVGLTCTYGWLLVGNAALAQWTDARLVNAAPPDHYGLPRVDEDHPDAKPALSDWTQKAMNDPATQNARYIITGVYEPAGAQSALRVVLLDRQKSGAQAEAPLFTVDNVAQSDFGRLAAHQRTAARAMIDKLIQLGLTKPRPAIDAREIRLDEEMKDVSRLLNANDGWAVMDGIDRALQLAALFPKDTMPLQAASYGLNELAWTLFHYGYESAYQGDYALRAYSLAQIALAGDSSPSMSHLNWVHTLLLMNQMLDQKLEAISGKDQTAACQQLAGYRKIITETDRTYLTMPETKWLPDWQVLHVEAMNSFMTGSSYVREYLDARTPYWENHDFYLQAAIQSAAGQYQYEKTGSPFSEMFECSVTATRSTVAAEMASLLVALKDDPSADELQNQLANLTALDAAKIKKLTTAGDYYGLRALFLSISTSWKSPYPPHPALGLLECLSEKADAVLKDPARRASPSGFMGFEFSSAERVQLAQRRDYLGFCLLADVEGKKRGVYDAFMAVMTAYMKARPDNVSARGELANQLDHYLDREKAVDTRLAALRVSSDLYPLDAYQVYLLGRTLYYLDQPKIGDLYLAAYGKTDPFNPYNEMYLGQLYRRYGFHAKAVEHLSRFVKTVPERYDIANERAWSLCQMGKWNDPEVRATFARPVPRLPGNPSFHEDNLEYLYYWAKDYPAARKAAEYYAQCHRDSATALRWQANIEKNDGKTSRGLEILDQADDRGLRSLALAIFHADLGCAYLDQGRIDQAEQHILKAGKIDNWQGNVIQASARLAYEKKDYDRAIQEHERGLKRYGFNADHVLGLANCYQKKGMPQESIRILEEQVLTSLPQAVPNGLIPPLIKLYAGQNNTEKADRVLDLLLKSANHYRGQIMDALSAYEKINPAKTIEIRNRVDAIMAKPAS